MRIGDGIVEGLGPIVCCGISAVEPSGAVTQLPVVVQSPLSLCLMKMYRVSNSSLCFQVWLGASYDFGMLSDTQKRDRQGR
jgi:hypothetical protein